MNTYTSSSLPNLHSIVDETVLCQCGTGIIQLVAASNIGIKARTLSGVVTRFVYWKLLWSPISMCKRLCGNKFRCCKIEWVHFFAYWTWSGAIFWSFFMYLLCTIFPSFCNWEKCPAANFVLKKSCGGKFTCEKSCVVKFFVPAILQMLQAMVWGMSHTHSLRYLYGIYL